MAARNLFGVGEHVSWRWLRGEAHGMIVESFPCRETRIIKGSRITRIGSEANPAYLIRQANGSEVLKLGSELHAD